MADKAKEIDDQNEVKPKRRFDKRDWEYIASYVYEEYERRKSARSDREKQWKEIDRQIAMIPDISFKKLPNGQVDTNMLWMSEMELPLQAQALEVLTADARRMMIPDSGPWFRAHTECTDDYLERIDFHSIIHGDTMEVPTKINQDNADKLAESYLLYQFGQYDFPTRLDRINAEAFKYGMGIGRARMETKNIYIHESRGVRKEERKIPVLVPVSVKNLYLDNPLPSMHSAQVLGPAHIAEDFISLSNLVLASTKGSTDPENEDGGWMPDGLSGIDGDAAGYVRILEMEGDIVVPRKTTRSMVLPGAIVTVVVGTTGTGKEQKTASSVIRFRWRKNAYSSYILFPYHYEDVTNPYPTSPLMKGRTVQIMAVGALNRLMDSGALKNAPPVSWDNTDLNFTTAGGPRIHPYALWACADPNSIKAHVEVGGDPATLANVLSLAINFYGELTGVLPARLGAQTVSHTTAYAKGAELQRGAVRTVDYVNQSGKGSLERWLYMAYQMGRDSLSSTEQTSFYVPAYDGFVTVTKDQLPENGIFEWFGAGGPQEEQTRLQKKVQSATLAIQLDNINAQSGKPREINIAEMQKELLRDGGWAHLDLIVNHADATAMPGIPPAVQVAGAQAIAPLVQD